MGSHANRMNLSSMDIIEFISLWPSIRDVACSYIIIIRSEHPSCTNLRKKNKSPPPPRGGVFKKNFSSINIMRGDYPKKGSLHPRAVKVDLWRFEKRLHGD